MINTHSARGWTGHTLCGKKIGHLTELSKDKLPSCRACLKVINPKLARKPKHPPAAESANKGDE